MIRLVNTAFRMFLWGVIMLSGLGVSASLGLGKETSAKGAAPEILEQQVSVTLDSLESVLENAGTVPVGVETSPREVPRVDRRAKTASARIEVQSSTNKPGGLEADDSHSEPQIRVTPVIATPIAPEPIYPRVERSGSNSSTQAQLGDKDETLYLRILILIASISTFFFSGGLLVRSNRGRYQRWHECNMM